MAISRHSLHLLRALRVAVGADADQATRTLTRAWVRAWDELAAQLRAAIDEVTATAVARGAWPHPWELARVERLQRALRQAEQTLAALGDRTGVTVTDAAGTTIRTTAQHEPEIIASQLPAAEQTAAAAQFSARILPTALDAMVARTQALIVNQARPLSGQAMEAMRRELIAGVALGDNPRDVAGRMVARVEGAFNGGLTRATNIARTEILDAYRSASRYSHAANADVVTGWVWLATLDRRCCVSCWSKHGSEYPVSTPGPWDHQQGRCARMPKVRPWSALGINVDEPPDLLPDAKARFNALPEADQLQIMGPARLELLKSGQIGWDDLARRRDSTGWRPSYTPTPVKDLVRTPQEGT